jgi:hypothetical protein
VDLLKVVPGSCNETRATFFDDGSGVINVKVEDVTDIQVEEDPVPLSCSLVKGEHEVS